MKHIVVGIDFSANSENALRHAIAIALKTQAKIHLVWVKTPTTASKLNATDETHMLDLAHERLSVLVELSKAEAPNNEITHVVLEGKAYLEISQYAYNLPDSLLVVGSHGASGFEEMFVGSNTMKIVGVTKVPVLIIGDHVKINRDLVKILAPIDTSFETLQKVEVAAQFAKAFAAKVSLLGVCAPCDAETRHVISVQLNHAENMCNQLNVRHSASTISVQGSAPHSVVEWAKKENVDLIMVMREEDDDITAFWLGSATRQLMNLAPMPLLVIPNVNHFDVAAR